MVILLTGATHTGKTQLAQRLLEEFDIPYFSIDHLKMGLIRSQNTDLSVEDDDKLTEYLWPIVREIIKTVIENHQNIIIEGCYIPFDWMYSFEEEYLKDIKFICLCMTDEYIVNHFEIIQKTSTIIENRLDDGFCTKELLMKQNLFYLEGCIEHDLKYLLINNDYEDCLNRIIKEILI